MLNKIREKISVLIALLLLSVLFLPIVTRAQIIIKGERGFTGITADMSEIEANKPFKLEQPYSNYWCIEISIRGYNWVNGVLQYTVWDEIGIYYKEPQDIDFTFLGARENVTSMRFWLIVIHPTGGYALDNGSTYTSIYSDSFPNITADDKLCFKGYIKRGGETYYSGVTSYGVLDIEFPSLVNIQPDIPYYINQTLRLNVSIYENYNLAWFKVGFWNTTTATNAFEYCLPVSSPTNHIFVFEVVIDTFQATNGKWGIVFTYLDEANLAGQTRIWLYVDNQEKQIILNQQEYDKNKGLEIVGVKRISWDLSLVDITLIDSWKLILHNISYPCNEYPLAIVSSTTSWVEVDFSLYPDGYYYFILEGLKENNVIYKYFFPNPKPYGWIFVGTTPSQLLMEAKAETLDISPDQEFKIYLNTWVNRGSLNVSFSLEVWKIVENAKIKDSRWRYSFEYATQTVSNTETPNIIAIKAPLDVSIGERYEIRIYAKEAATKRVWMYDMATGKTAEVVPEEIPIFLSPSFWFLIVIIITVIVLLLIAQNLRKCRKLICKIDKRRRSL